MDYIAEKLKLILCVSGKKSQNHRQTDNIGTAHNHNPQPIGPQQRRLPPMVAATHDSGKHPPHQNQARQQPTNPADKVPKCPSTIPKEQEEQKARKEQGEQKQFVECRHSAYSVSSNQQQMTKLEATASAVISSGDTDSSTRNSPPQCSPSDDGRVLMLQTSGRSGDDISAFSDQSYQFDSGSSSTDSTSAASSIISTSFISRQTSKEDANTEEQVAEAYPIFISPLVTLNNRPATLRSRHIASDMSSSESSISSIRNHRSRNLSHARSASRMLTTKPSSKGANKNAHLLFNVSDLLVKKDDTDLCIRRDQKLQSKSQKDLPTTLNRLRTDDNNQNEGRRTADEPPSSENANACPTNHRSAAPLQSHSVDHRNHRSSTRPSFITKSLSRPLSVILQDVTLRNNQNNSFNANLKKGQVILPSISSSIDFLKPSLPSAATSAATVALPPITTHHFHR